MERLTENIKIELKDKTINTYAIKNFCEDDMQYNMAESQIEIIDKVINKLGEYEDTGLTPKEIIDLKKNAIVPKFKIGQEVYYIYTKQKWIINKIKIGIADWINNELFILYELGVPNTDDYICVYEYENQLYTTQAEAEQALAKLKG